MVLLRKQAFRALEQLVTETILDYVNCADDVQAPLMQGDSGCFRMIRFIVLKRCCFPVMNMSFL